MTDATCQQDCDNLATGPGGGAGSDDSGGSSTIVIVIIALALFLLTALGYLYWRRMRGKENEKDGDRSTASIAGGWFSKKDKETQSQKTAKADDSSVTPYSVRRKIYFLCVHFPPSFHSTHLFSILAR